jgi:flagellar biosynthesis GTPase FlhF
MAVRMDEGGFWGRVGWKAPAKQEAQSTDLVALRNEVGQQLGELHRFIRTQAVEYKKVADGMQAEINGLQKEKGVFATRLHQVEGELAGARAANASMQATLQRKDAQIAQLSQTVQNQAAQTSQLSQQLAVLQQEQQDQRARDSTRQTLLNQTVQKSSTQDLLNTKRQEKQALEAELAQAQVALRAKQNNIVVPAGLIAGGLFAFVTGGLGGLLVGMTGGTLVSKAATDSANCPCMTEHFATVASIQARLGLIDQEIARLESIFSPKKLS